MNITKQQNSKLTQVIFDSHRCVGKLLGSYSLQVRWQVAGQLQLHCLSSGILFIPCVCAFTYLSSLIIFTADTSSSSHPLSAVVNHAHEHVNIPKYTEYFRVYTDLGNEGTTNMG